ncbi:hypothetical protein D3C71_1690650 [compost metagenome]
MREEMHHNCLWIDLLVYGIVILPAMRQITSKQDQLGALKILNMIPYKTFSATVFQQNNFKIDMRF